ncbi:MAG: GNAT family N-acetyltransferase [Corynebacterium sp.]|nr:GNAT family N-acetyltransferase [Corynebacterium sp.]
MENFERIRAIEYATARAFPGIEHQMVHGWLLRAGDGITERSNSAAPLEPEAWEKPLPLAPIEAFYHAHGLAPQVLVPDELGVKATGLLDEGWVAGPEIMTLYRDLHDVVVPVKKGYYCRFSAQPCRNWLDMYHFRGKPLPLSALNLLRSSIDGEMIFASLCADSGKTVAITRGTLTADHRGNWWLGYSAVEVHPDYRQRGLGTLLGLQVLDWGARKGASHAYLQVLASNEAGRALYERLEFEKSHAHRYFSNPS